MSGAYFIDIDGTIFQHGTDRPLEGAIEQVNALYDAGAMIVLTTRRGSKEWKGHRIYDEEPTLRALRASRIKYHTILWDVPSPRIVINDSGAYGIPHPKNVYWVKENPIEKLKFMTQLG